MFFRRINLNHARSYVRNERLHHHSHNTPRSHKYSTGLRPVFFFACINFIILFHLNVYNWRLLVLKLQRLGADIVRVNIEERRKLRKEYSRKQSHSFFLANWFGSDIAIDLGTANIIVFVKNRGIVVNEPAVIAVDTMENKVVAIGREAQAMLGRTPRNIHAYHRRATASSPTTTRRNTCCATSSARPSARH